MLVGVCCTCQQGGKPLRYERERAIIDSHDAFGSSCEGEGTAPQATYQDSSGSDQMPEGVQVAIGNGLPIVKDQGPSIEEFLNGTAITFGGKTYRIQEDQFDKEEREREQAKEDEKNVCCFDPWCNHHGKTSPPGMFGTIGDIVLAAKNGKQKTKKKG